MNLRRIKKNITKDCFLFEGDMYTDFVGSIVITSYILNGQTADRKAIRKQWKSIKRNGLDFDMSDKDFISKVLNLFNMPPIPDGTAALVNYSCGKYNGLLVAPYDAESKRVFPLREDGFASLTLRKGKIYPIKEGVKNELA